METIAADVRVHPSDDWLYASNCGHDSITPFDLRNDDLRQRVGHADGR